MIDILTELAQFGFIASIVFLFFIILNILIKIFGNYKLGKNTKLNLGLTDKAILWCSVSYILTYLF
jgi:uncharacterized membrane-anchored protein YitT (DUF2179 family)